MYNISTLEDIFLLDSINDYKQKHFTVYKYDGKEVPRVSEILKECISKEFLINWAARIGSKQLYLERKKATEIGSYVHEMIGHYLLNRTDMNISFKVPDYYVYSIRIAYNNFKDWEKYINSLGYFIEEIIGIEIKISCPLYGGTIDCIMKINGKYYIVDFKTSKSISHEYIIQTCSYMWIVNHGYCPKLPHIDGIGIIRVDKENKKFEDLFLNEHIPSQKEIIDQYYNGFGYLLGSFYHNINMKLLFSSYRKEYLIEEALI